jgi:adenylylsulfate kinase
MNAGSEQAVLITGVYGSGKSAAAQEMAYLLDQQSVAYALVDLDFLGWADTKSPGPQAWPEVMLRNLAAVVGNYREAGIHRFVLAGAIRNVAELEAVKAALAMPVKVVRLDVALHDIEQRLQSDPTAGRRDDLRQAATWIEDSVGVGIEDRAISNDGAIRDVATDVLQWLDWAEDPAN